MYLSLNAVIYSFQILIYYSNKYLALHYVRWELMREKNKKKLGYKFTQESERTFVWSRKRLIDRQTTYVTVWGTVFNVRYRPKSIPDLTPIAAQLKAIQSNSELHLRLSIVLAARRWYNMFSFSFNSFQN